MYTATHSPDMIFFHHDVVKPRSWKLSGKKKEFHDTSHEHRISNYKTNNFLRRQHLKIGHREQRFRLILSRGFFPKPHLNWQLVAHLPADHHHLEIKAFSFVLHSRTTSQPIAYHHHHHHHHLVSNIHVQLNSSYGEAYLCIFCCLFQE
ncbi:unnamed protein product [Lactuca virosa]|uniref:Uncharacterized protein n=1 Tax=Lactuca virosa TaxID=75947 RepID=A0AAU9LTC0_9ASTR|nr:unnamed protein product [Lactuca virosa]